VFPDYNRPDSLLLSMKFFFRLFVSLDYLYVNESLFSEKLRLCCVERSMACAIRIIYNPLKFTVWISAYFKFEVSNIHEKVVS